MRDDTIGLLTVEGSKANAASSNGPYGAMTMRRQTAHLQSRTYNHGSARFESKAPSGCQKVGDVKIVGKVKSTHP